MQSELLSRPAGFAIDTLARSLEARRREKARRRGLKRLLDLDDQMLDDIGVMRWEVSEAVSLPLSADAATELRRMSLSRRRSRM